MTWGRTSDRVDHRLRSLALSGNLAACGSPAGMPARGNARAGLGSRGGAAIWVMREAWMPRTETHGQWMRNGQPRRTTPVGVDRAPDMADPDGFAVFGRFSKGWLRHILRLELLGRGVGRDDVLHVCSGTLGPEERWTVDLRPEARPRVVATGCALPFRDGSVRAVLLDPPYSDQYARNLYGTENPRPSWLLREAARVVVPGGRIGILHVAIPFAPPGCRLVTVYGVTTGVGFRIRALTLYERAQAELTLEHGGRDA